LLADEPFTCAALLNRLRSHSPEVTHNDRLAIAQYLEEYSTALLLDPDLEDFDAAITRSEGIRNDVRDALVEFGITGVLCDEIIKSLYESAPAAPGHSTGPRTEAGLARSSQNARKHGLSSLTSVFVMMPGEDPQEWVQLVDDLNAEFQPASRTERILITDMAQSHWLTQRAVNLQTSHIEDPKALGLYIRYQTTHHRAYFRALKQLMALQKERAKSVPTSIAVPKLSTPSPTVSIAKQEPATIAISAANGETGLPAPRRAA
jgi:hypothetical protein